MKSGKLSFLSLVKVLLAAIITSIVVFFIGISLVSCNDATHTLGAEVTKLFEQTAIKYRT